MIKVLPLVGIESFYCTQAIHKFVYGLKMLPMFWNDGYEEFVAKLDAMDEAGQENALRVAALMVKPDSEELFDIIKFSADANGIPYTRENVKNVPPEMFHEIIVAVGSEVIKSHKIRLISDKEKKN